MGLPFVDDTGIEPVTPTMSMWCSTAEPIVLVPTDSRSVAVVYNERTLHPSEVIFDPDNIVFAEVGASLDFHKEQLLRPRVGDPMKLSDGDIDA